MRLGRGKNHDAIDMGIGVATVAQIERAGRCDCHRRRSICARRGVNVVGFNTGVYNDDWGVGIRLNIPQLGPLRLDYAFPITHGPDTSGSGRFQFSVGYERPF